MKSYKHNYDTNRMQFVYSMPQESTYLDKKDNLHKYTKDLNVIHYDKASINEIFLQDCNLDTFKTLASNESSEWLKAQIWNIISYTCNEGLICETKKIIDLCSYLNFSTDILFYSNLIDQGMFYALKNSHFNIVDLLFSLKNVNYSYFYQSTEICIYLDDFKMLNKLLCLGLNLNNNFIIDINKKHISALIQLSDATYYYDLFLERALKYNAVNCFKLLVSQVDLDVTNLSISFIQMCKQNDINNIKALIDKGFNYNSLIDINFPSLFEEPLLNLAIYTAIINNSDDVIQYLINKQEIDYNYFDRPFFASLENNRFDLAKTFIDNGYDLPESKYLDYLFILESTPIKLRDLILAGLYKSIEYKDDYIYNFLFKSIKDVISEDELLKLKIINSI